MTKILILGDPHGKLPKNINSIVKQNKIELIIITGDIGKSDLAKKQFLEDIKRKKQGLSEKIHSKKEVKKAWMEIYNSTIKTLKGLSKLAPVYLIKGNVPASSDIEIKKKGQKLGIKLPLFTLNIRKIPNVFYLNNKIKKFHNLRIGGLEYFIDSSWIKEFKETDIKRILSAKIQTFKAKKILQKFDKIDILLCHSPPYKILDKVNSSQAPKHWKGKHAGSKVISDYIKKQQPKYVFCGHIHEGKGKAKIGKTEVYNVGHEGDYLILDIN
ncbi:MAG: metallophosphoesterase [Nanoarchaeota archaeon]